MIIQKLYGGGAEHAMARLAAAWAKEHQVVLALTDPDPFRGGCYGTGPGVRILRYPGNDRSLPRRVLWIRAVKKTWRPDVSISFLPGPDMMNVLSGTKVPAVISIRRAKPPAGAADPAERLKWLSDLFAARLAAGTVAVSGGILRELRERTGLSEDRSTCIYNGLDLQQIRKQAAALPEQEAFLRFRAAHPMLLVSAGRLTAQKGQIHLIRAFRQIRERHPEAGLVIFGEGGLRNALEACIRDLGLQEHVLLAGETRELPSCLVRSDLFVMSSLFEGFSNAMLEAMALGLPVISADCPTGPRELLAPETDPARKAEAPEYASFGVLTPPMSGGKKAEEAFAGAVMRLLEEPALLAHYRRQSLRRAEAYSMERIFPQWEALCRALAGIG